MQFHFAQYEKNLIRCSIQIKEEITLVCRNETHFAQIFISVNLTEMNIHFSLVNTGARDDIKPTANILSV